MLWRTKYWRHQPVNNQGCCLKNKKKMVFEVTINIHVQSAYKRPLTTNPHFVSNIYKPVCLQNRFFFWCFDAGLEHMSARSRGNGTNFDWLRKSFDITCSTFDLLVTCWERADLLALVCGVYYEFVTFPLVSWVRCGTWCIDSWSLRPYLLCWVVISNFIQILKVYSVCK